MSTKRRAAHLLLAGLTATTVGSTVLSAPVQAAEVATAAAAGVVADPTNLASAEEKVKAAAAIGVNITVEMLLADDQAFVLALWRNALPGSYVQAEALRAYDNSDPQAAYQFITVGVFAAAADDAQAEIAAEHAKALRRSVLVTIGLDSSDTALVDLTDLNFIIAVWQRVEEGSFVQAAAAEAIKGTQADWTTFLTTGAATARAADIDKQLKDATEAEAARIRAEQLAAAKKSLLQLLLLPVTQELIDAPNRQFVLSVHATAKGTEVVLAAQAALNAADADLDKALSDFIFTDGAAANTKDEQVAAAKELAAYRTRVTAIRDAAVADGWQPSLVAAANQALADNTLLGLQTFVLKGQDVARAQDDTWVATFVRDFNGDRKRDIVGIDANGDMKYYIGDGAGKLSEGGAMWATGGLWKNHKWITSGDFNGDLKADVVAVDAVGNLKLYVGNGAGKLSEGGAMWPTGGVFTNYKGLVAGDFNGDSKTDVAGIDAAGAMRLYLGDGTGKVTDGGAMGGGWSGFKAVVAGDFNGDRKTDIAGIDANNDMKLYAGDGAGKIVAGTVMWPVGGHWSGFKGIVAGDFNGDRKTDIAGIDAGNDMKLYVGDGAGKLSGGTAMWGTGGRWAGFKRIG
ncbi:VCBS repeat-containing protein [Actinoplanes sp. L3-i22]|uniref:FG-GAP repeat domain-containing protein n=1 Tax=Actinoplanes sp. L3-i22 TaxID=2836373 RepID=UPI001C850D86|nr:VCBS repeat-containing protein [Actinoplanes sp. L3-i22]